ncbi:MAG TPA: serine hydrolase, partial [Miltoncostaea sp.]|nr:serine hydrolase [Miltoncostaea sp.]
MPRRLAVLAVMATLLAAVPGIAAAPRVAAPAYIVLNPATGETLAQRAADRELPMASTTKIMTALIVLEHADLDDEFTVPEEAVEIGGSTAHLEEGERLSVRDL